MQQFEKQLRATDQDEADEFMAAVAFQMKDEVELLPYRWWYRGRSKQIMPAEDHDIFLILAGRGFGKTYAGANCIIDGIEHKGWKNIALIGQTIKDVNKVMIRAKGGILNQAYPWNMPLWKEQKGELIFPNGAICHRFSGDEWDQLRGPEHHAAWMDEPAKMKAPDETLDMCLMGLRLGDRPQMIITGTPRPIKIIKDLVQAAEAPGTMLRKNEDEDDDEVPLRVMLSRGSTYDNRGNLPPSYIAILKKKYAGTRLGDQEIEAKVLDDNIHALFQKSQFDCDRVDTCPEDFISIVIGVDPATTDTKSSDDTGIIAVGRRDEPDGNSHYYLLADKTQTMASPDVWAQATIKLYEELSERFPSVPLRVVGESNQGGQMVADTIHSRNDSIPVELVHASKGKRARAEPISALHEQGRVHPIAARTQELEDECSEWEPDVTPESPNRLDAMVWAIAKQAGEVKAWNFVRQSTHQAALKPVVSKLRGKWVYEFEHGPGQKYIGQLVRAVWLSSTGQSAALWAHISVNGWWMIFDSLLSKREIPTRDFMTQVVQNSKEHDYSCNVISGSQFNDPVALDNYRKPTTLQQEICQLDRSGPIFHSASLVKGQDSLSTITSMLTARLATSKIGKKDPYWQVIGRDPIEYYGEPNLSIYPDNVISALRQAKFHTAPKGDNEFDIPEGLVNDGGPLIRCLRLLVVSGAGKRLNTIGE